MDTGISISEKLKDAGIGDGSFGFLDGTKIPIVSGLTLSELIENCGERFVSLDKVENDWRAIGWITDKWNATMVFGNTPEEAVSELYLLLNKK